jgi:hypothetical protein
LTADIQGDQIGRIFAFWAVAYLGQWFENYRNSAIFWATFMYVCINCDKKWWLFTLGIFLMAELAKIFGQLFPNVQVMYLF